MKVKMAYEACGYSGGDAARWHLRNDPAIKARVDFIVSERIKAQAIAAAAPEKKLADSRARLIRELERIAYGDFRELVQWERRPQYDETGKLLGFADVIIATPSERLSRDAAAGIKSVTTKGGTLKLERHDKIAALLALAKIHGLLDKEKVGPSQAVTVNQVNVGETNALEAIRKVAFMLGALRAREREQIDAAPAQCEPTADKTKD